MSEGDSDFRIRPGRIQSHSRAEGRRASSTRCCGPRRRRAIPLRRRQVDVRPAMAARPSAGAAAASAAAVCSARPRRVVVKARVVRHHGRSFRSAPLSAHLSYLKREGVSRDGEKGVMFDAGSDRADDRAFAERCKDDRHHFRFIVSPEDAGEMTDLKAFTRDLAQQMEADLGTPARLGCRRSLEHRQPSCPSPRTRRG